MSPKTVSFRTLGCKQNQYDTDYLKDTFRERGFQVRDGGPTDLVVVNTCAVTSKSAAKCRQAIRAAARTGAKVIVTGCYAQVSGEELAGIPGVIVVGGVRGRGELASLAEQALGQAGDCPIMAVRPHEEGQAFEETPVPSPSLTRAFIKIQEGCGDFCSYCIVPYARGPSRSRGVDAVLAEVENLVEKGFKEIVLTGTHLGLYEAAYGSDTVGLSDVLPEPSSSADAAQADGRDTDELFDTIPAPSPPAKDAQCDWVDTAAPPDAISAPLSPTDTAHHAGDNIVRLPGIIRRICEIKGLMRLRVSSLEPHDVTPDLIHCLRFPQVCQHLHLPLQSGSDDVLKRMGRRYDRAEFLRIVDEVRKVVPDLGISTDIIVGFPGEAEEDFRDTLAVARAAAFSRIHAFKYSPRPGTRASEFGGKVPEKEKDARAQRLIQLGRELSNDFHSKHIGKAVEILVEDDRAPDGSLTGVTRNYIRAYIEGGDRLRGQLLQATAVCLTPDGVFCEA